MKRLLLITVCLFCILPALRAQSQTGARIWLDSPLKLKQPIILGFMMGGLAMQDKIGERLSAVGGNYRKKISKAELKTGLERPGRPAPQKPWDRDMTVLVASMDAFYRRPENKDVDLNDALYTIIFEPETAEKKSGNDKK